MIAEVTEEENEVSVLTENLQNVNKINLPFQENSHEIEISNYTRSGDLNRGFNRFIQYGMSIEEIHILRVLFHTAISAQNRERNSENWTQDEIFNREEAWLNSNNEVFPVRLYVRRNDNVVLNRNLAILNV